MDQRDTESVGQVGEAKKNREERPGDIAGQTRPADELPESDTDAEQTNETISLSKQSVDAPDRPTFRNVDL